MHFSIARAQKLHDQAVETMKAGNVALSAENYMIWYNDAAGEFPELTASLRQHKEDGKSFDHESCRKLYKHFFCNDEQIKSIRESCKEIETRTNDISTEIKESTNQLIYCKEKLSKYYGKIGEISTNDELIKTVKKMFAEISDIMCNVESNLVKAEKSSEEISNIRYSIESHSCQNEKDRTTGLYNREYLQKTFYSFCQKLQLDDEKTPICCLLITIDEFKKHTENYGPRLGNQILYDLAKTMRQNLKGYDLAARYGNEEFAVILPHTSLGDALAAADNIRKDISKKSIRSKGKIRDRITISGGCAEYQESDDLDSLAKRAAAGLAEARSLGGNRIQLST